MFEIIAGAEEALRRRGYALELRGTDKMDAAEAARDVIVRRSADALVVHVSVMSHALSALLTERRFPHMVLGVPGFSSQVCWVDINHVYSGVLAAEHLLPAGLSAHRVHRRAGLRSELRQPAGGGAQGACGRRTPAG